MTRYLQAFFTAALILISATTAHADPAPGDGCATNNQVMHSGGPENSGNAYYMVCQGGTWRQIYSSDNTGMMSTNTPTAAAHVATKAYVDSMASGGLPTQIFTSSGTFVVPANVYHLKIIVVGGGGGGAAANNQSPGPSYYNSVGSCGSGGGYAGAKAQTASFPVTPGASIPVTVGQGGQEVRHVQMRRMLFVETREEIAVLALTLFHREVPAASEIPFIMMAEITGMCVTTVTVAPV